MKEGSHFTPEQKANISMGTRRALSNPTIRDRMSQATKLAWQDPKKRTKIIEGSKKKYSDSTTLKRKSQATKLAWQDPEKRMKFIEGSGKRYSKPEEIEKASKRCKAAWANTEIRAKYMLSLASEEYLEKVSGKNHHNWVDGRSFIPYCPKFSAKLKEEIRKKYSYKCVHCGKDQKDNKSKTGKVFRLSVHHNDGDKMQGCNGKKWNLIPLCMTCHRKEEERIKVCRKSLQKL